jgi:hypothetical protein
MKSSIYSPAYDKLRAWLKDRREEQGLSLRAAAERVSRHHSVLGKMEQDRKIDVVEFVEYCIALDADPHEGLDVLIGSLDQGRSKRKNR